LLKLLSVSLQSLVDLCFDFGKGVLDVMHENLMDKRLARNLQIVLLYIGKPTMFNLRARYGVPQY
jgi:hypothetical protein